jgi:hypothetical protein
MKPSLRVALTLAVIVVMGVFAFIKMMTQATFPTAYFVIWIVVSVILIGMAVWSWLRDKKK